MNEIVFYLSDPLHSHFTKGPPAVVKDFQGIDVEEPVSGTFSLSHLTIHSHTALVLDSNQLSFEF